VYAVLPSYSLGFHGCDRAVAERIFSAKQYLQRSQNAFDWLGEGIYFWENSPARALDYAKDLNKRPRPSGPQIKVPAVIGAVIELGYCLNLLDVEFLSLMRESYQDLDAVHAAIGVPLPRNKNIRGDLLLSPLDCAVINFMHRAREEKQLRPFDTVRAAFAEGGPLFPGSGITAKHHIQLCVRRRSCIKGYFRPMNEGDLPSD
jgi:hypothetical protein